MVVVSINGISVEFPYEPYPIQINYMESVIVALKSKKNALLESPTGTGKTLCLLCAALAWLDYEKIRRRLEGEPISLVDNRFDRNSRSKTGDENAFPNPPRIIYASRTHSQLAQVMQELKKTPYGRMNRVAVLGSRDQLCINPQVMGMVNIAAKNKVCRTKIRTHSCAFYQKFEETKEASVASTPLADIEELVKYGKKSRVCPYYLSKASEKNADIMFLPYNYVFDPSIRRTMKLDLDGAIVILDEGHNVGKVCEDSYSQEISSVDLATSIMEVKKILKQLVNTPSAPAVRGKNLPAEDLDDSADEKARGVAELLKTLIEFEKAFQAISLQDDANEGIVKPMSFLQDLFERSRVNKTTYPTLMDSARILLMETEGTDPSTSIAAHNVGVLQKFQDLMEMACSGETAHHHGFFRVYMRNDDFRKRLRNGWSGEGIQTKQSRILSVWCMSPGCTMKTLMSSGIHSMIITSGTLSPVQPLLQEMVIPFPVQLFNPHVIKSNQVWAGVCSKGPDNVEWSSLFKNRDSIEYRRSLGRGIANFFEVIPDGILIFFPSYRAMTDMVDTWKSCELWENFSRRKTCFVEPTNRDEFTAMLAEYFKLVREEGKGAAFFGVCRGKISEGVDFPDDCARAVIITGLPYPNKFEPKIRVKMEYLSQTYGNPETRTLSANDWYNREAWSAVNQALGRVIRHINDFGACILCDCRFDSDQSRKQLSGWLRNYLRSYSVPLAKRSLSEFFRTQNPASKAKVRSILPKTTVEWDHLAYNVSDTLHYEGSSAELPMCSQPTQSFAVDFHSESLAVPHHLSPPSKKKMSVFEAIGQHDRVSSQSSASKSDSHMEQHPTVSESSADLFSTRPFGLKKLVVKPNIFSQPANPLPESRLTSSKSSFDRTVERLSSGSSQKEKKGKGTQNRPSKMSISQKPETSNFFAPRETKLGSATLSLKKSTPKPTSLSNPFTQKDSLVNQPANSPLQNVLLQIKKDLDQPAFSELESEIKLMMSDTKTISCGQFTTCLKSLPDISMRNRISHQFSRVLPSRFREEFDLFLREIGLLCILD